MITDFKYQEWFSARFRYDMAVKRHVASMFFARLKIDEINQLVDFEEIEEEGGNILIECRLKEKIS